LFHDVFSQFRPQAQSGFWADKFGNQFHTFPETAKFTRMSGTAKPQQKRSLGIQTAKYAKNAKSRKTKRFHAETRRRGEKKLEFNRRKHKDRKEWIIDVWRWFLGWRQRRLTAAFRENSQSQGLQPVEWVAEP